MSLTGSTAQEGLLTKQGYDLCQQVVDGKGGVKVGGKSYQLNVVYQDDTSKPDTAAQIIDQYNDQGVKLILGPYGSAATAATAPVVERNGQVMVDSSGADDAIFSKGYRRTFAVLSPASVYVASIVDAAVEVANPKPKTVVFLSADDGFSKPPATGDRVLPERCHRRERGVDQDQGPEGRPHHRLGAPGRGHRHHQAK
jgi:branched-chain amino acid transport system substrate-binding protein